MSGLFVVWIDVAVNRGDVLDNLCKWQGHATALYPTLTGPSLLSLLLSAIPLHDLNFLRPFALSEKEGEKKRLALYVRVNRKPSAGFLAHHLRTSS